MLSAGLSKYLAVTAVVLSFAAGWYVRSLRAELQEKTDQVETQKAADSARQIVEATNDETRSSETQTDSNYQQGIALLVKQRNALAVELERLRVAANRVPKPAVSEAGSCAPSAETAPSAADSLLECAAELAAVAEAHDALSLQVTGLLEINERNEHLLRDR